MLAAVTFLDEAMQDPSDTPAHKPVPSLGALPSLPARVTLEDVRGALGSTPATGTNAGALRKVLGRGSLSTIQKHLDALRVQAAAPAQAQENQAVSMPLELAQALWHHAMQAARNAVVDDLAQAQARALKAEDALAVARADCAAALAQADSDARERAQAEATLRQVQAHANSQALRHEATLGALRAEIDRLAALRPARARAAAKKAKPDPAPPPAPLPAVRKRRAQSPGG